MPERLRRGEREFALPGELCVGGETIECIQMLRLLPGKRAVMKAHWQERTVLVKLLPDTPFGRRTVRRELAGHEILKAAGVLTPDLLFTARDGGQSQVLVFEFLQHAQPLGEVWRTQTDRRLSVAAEALELVALLHRKGCYHTDLHLDNFLLAGGLMYVVDAASVTSRRCAGYGKWQRDNLALFLAQFTPVWRETITGFLAQFYAEAATDHALEKAVERAWRRRKSRYLKKCFRESSEFSTHSNWHRMAAWKRASANADMLSFLQNPDAWVEQGERLKDGSSATVVRVQMDGRSVVIKRNNFRHVGHWLRRCLSPTRGCINWRNAHLLKISGMATPEPLACVEKRWGPLRLGGYYVCAFSEFPSAEKKYKFQPPTESELARFKALFDGMRLARIYHGDFKASNFLVGDEDIVLIDLDALKECHSKNKMNTLSQKDRRRFLKNWQDKPEQLQQFSKMFNRM